MLSKGTPILLKKVSNEESINNKRNEDQSKNLKDKDIPNTSKDIRGILLGATDNNIKIKLISRSVNLTDIENAEFKILPVNEYTPFDNLLKLLSNRKDWNEFPGFQLLLYTYRARQLPVTFSDRPITLPKVQFCYI